MKIVEGLKRLKYIEKKMKQNQKKITQYASLSSSQNPIFKTTQEQERQVMLLVEENKSLFEEYLDLKHRIDKTNNSVCVTIRNETRTINQFLTIHRNLGKLLVDTFHSLNDETACLKLRNDPEWSHHKTIRCYDEITKNSMIEYWNDVIEEISGVLEVTNATTDIIDK